MNIREEIAEVVTPLAKNYVLDYIHNLNQLEPELKKQVDYVTSSILSHLKSQIEQMPLLTPEELCHLNEIWEDEYENIPMTDADWELKRWHLICEAQKQDFLALFSKGG